MAQTLEKSVISPGDGTLKPKVGDTVIMEYTGWLYEPGKPQNRGKQFDSSKDRGEFKTQIGVGKVIQGWDEGVVDMTLGEKTELTIPAHMAYGTQGFHPIIPANSSLIFEVELKAINGQRA